MDILQVLSMVAAAVIAGTAVWLFRGQRIASLMTENSLLRNDGKELVEARKKILDLSNENASLKTEIGKAREAKDEQIGQLTNLHSEIQNKLQSIAGEALQKNSQGFLDAASSKLNPFTETFSRYESLLQKMENDRQNAFGGINSELTNVRNQLAAGHTITNRLVNALRAAPKARGRWGEQSLQRVMELAGMIRYCDFDLEKQYRRLDELLRPDAVLHLAGDRHIIVDAKAPIAAFLDSVEAESEEQREAHLVRHAAQLRERMQSLASKSYWEKLDGTPDCVVMFVPGDNFFSAAIERDPMLFDDAISKRVLIATPTTFIALAKAIAYGWRQQTFAESAAHLADVGRELYQRLATMGGYLVNMGTGLKRAVEEYNRFVGSLEGSVMPQARKFHDLGVEGTSKGIAVIEPVEVEAREVRQDRDLLFEISHLVEGPARSGDAS